MTEQAKVIDINGEKITVACMASACASCASQGSCAVKEQKWIARNNNAIPLSEGDMVEIYLPPGKTVGAAFAVMILPLILFIAAYLAGARLAGIESEGVNVLLGLGGLGLGFAVNLLFSAILKKGSYPVIKARV